MAFSPPALDTLEEEQQKFTPPPIDSVEEEPAVPTPNQFLSSYKIDPGTATDLTTAYDKAANPIATAATQAAENTIKGFVPHSVLDAAKLATPAASVPEEISKNYHSLKDILFGGKGLEETERKYFPERYVVKDAEKTAPYSLERFEAGFGVVAQALMGAGIVHGFPKLSDTLSPIIGKPETAAEPVATEAAVRATPGQVETIKRVQGEQVAAKEDRANLQIGQTGEPVPEGLPEATVEGAPKVREALSLEELRLMRERSDLQIQADISKRVSGLVHPALGERISEINSQLDEIANRELATQPKGGEGNASEIPKNEAGNAEGVRQVEGGEDSSRNVEQAPQGQTDGGAGPEVAPIRTAVKAGDQTVTGETANEPHDAVGIRNGIEEVKPEDKGFAVPDGQGGTKFVSRTEGFPIADEAGRLNEEGLAEKALAEKENRSPELKSEFLKPESQEAVQPGEFEKEGYTATEPKPAESTGISTERLQETYGEDAVIINQGKGAKEWQRIGQADTRDPYAVLSENQKQGFATAKDTALLRAEHQRLLEAARQSYGKSEYSELAQRAADIANATKEVAHGPASDVFRALQEVDVPRFDSPADFDAIVRERMKRESTPVERETFSKIAEELKNGDKEVVAKATESQTKLRQYRPKENVPFDEASKFVREQIKKLTEPCAL